MYDLISICLATYNGEKYLEEQLNSLLNQSYKNIEIIIQDDCSSDDTWEILKKYSKKHDNIMIYKNEKNLGYVRNFESVIKRANGNLIAMCDQDDIFLPQKIEKLYNNIGDATLIYSNSLLVDKNGNSLKINLDDNYSINFINSNSMLNFLYDNCVSAHSILFKKTLLKAIFPFPSFSYFDAWIASHAANMNGVRFFNETLVLYRQHDTNTLSTYTHSHSKKTLFERLQHSFKGKNNDRQLMIFKIEEFLKTNVLKDKEYILLRQLLIYYENCFNKYFDLSMFIFLLRNKNIYFPIKNKNKILQCFKESRGLKLYKRLK